MDVRISLRSGIKDSTTMHQRKSVGTFVRRRTKGIIINIAVPAEIEVGNKKGKKGKTTRT